ncbi:MAG TPA: hypothetical protein VNS63_08935 [Blastocatellia bacterium]|nr:hypothetical protein [Blastocatellia bacterium]
MNSIKRGHSDSEAPQASPSLKIARYNLVLMDHEGQVVWTGEWDAGGEFEFGPRHSLRIFCEFTNHSKREAEIAEYEIELMSEDGLVVGRFGNSFGDALVVDPGQSKVLTGQWQL